jgi:site-specific recombinase XerD
MRNLVLAESPVTRKALEKTDAYIQEAKAANTRRAYRSDWQDFAAWCGAANRCALPADPPTVALYLTTLAEVARVSTLTRRLSSISQAHQAASHSSPTQEVLVRTVMAGIRRVKGTAQAGKRPLSVEDLRKMTAKLPDTVQGIRDRAVLLLGFAGAFRRSELVALDGDDLVFTGDGLTVTIRRSKTDQEGEGRKVGIPYGSNPKTCPIRAMKAWLDRIEGAPGAVFCPINRHGQFGKGRLTPQGVAIIVKRWTGQAGLGSLDYAGHSLRAGLATAAAAAGVSERAIMAQTGHKSLTTVRKYIREGSLFLENAAARVGL